ncbi:MFS transporter [Chloroflexota bacterium]
MTSSSDSLAAASRWSRTIRSLRHRDFRIYWTGQVVSMVGTWMQIVAQGWIVYALTDSPLMLGLVSFAGLLPVLPISLAAGVLSDRYSRRSIMMVTESVLMLQAFAMAALIWLDVIQVWHIILLSFILGAAAAMEQPARLAIVADIVGDEDLSNAVALNSGGNNTARIIGPSIAGLIIATYGGAACFLINGITYLVFILALFAIRVPRQSLSSDQERFVTSLSDGFKYIMQSKVILGLLFIISVASFLTIPYIALMPVFAKDILQVGASGLGFLLTAVGVGAILGAILVAYLQPGRRGKWLTIANFVGPVFLVLFSFSGTLPLSLLFVVFVGASNAIRLTLANSLAQLNSAKEYHGRVMSIFNLLFNGMSRVGALFIGGFAELTNIAWVLGISAAASAIIGLVVIYRMPQVRRLP